MLDSMNSSIELSVKQMLIVLVGVYYYESCIIACAVLLFLLCYYSQRTAQNLVEDDKKKINATRNSLLWELLQWIQSQNTYRNTVNAVRVRENANVITGARTGA